MKKTRLLYIMILLLTCLLLNACEADKSIPLYMLSDLKSGPSAQLKPENQAALEEFTDRYIYANYYMLEPDSEKEKLLYGIDTGYKSINDEEQLKLTKLIDILIKTYYNINYPYSEFSDEIEDYFTKDLNNIISDDPYLNQRLNYFKEYNANTIIEHVRYLPYNLTKVFSAAGNKEIYRIWVEIYASTDASNEEFYERTHYVHGALFLELYVYLIKDSENEYRICGWDEVNHDPDLEVLYTAQGIEEFKDSFERRPIDNITPKNLIQDYVYLDLFELQQQQKQKLIQTADNMINLFLNVDYHNISLENLSPIYVLLSEDLKAELKNHNVFEDYIKSVKLNNAIIKTKLMNDDPFLFVYTNSKGDYIVFNLLYDLYCESTGIIDCQNYRISNGSKSILASFVVKPLEDGGYQINDFLLIDGTFLK